MKLEDVVRSIAGCIFIFSGAISMSYNPFIGVPSVSLGVYCIKTGYEGFAKKLRTEALDYFSKLRLAYRTLRIKSYKS